MFGMALAKLASGWMQRAPLMEDVRDHEGPRDFANIIMQTCPIQFRPKVQFMVKENARGDIDKLPKNAKLPRKWRRVSQ